MSSNPVPPTSALILRPEEPAAGPWERWPLDRLVDTVAAAKAKTSRPGVVAVDGRGASGKFTLATRLEPAATGHAVRFRPPAWEERGRPGAIVVPA